MEIIRTIDLNDQQASVQLIRNNEKFKIIRKAKRNNIINYIENYEKICDNKENILLPINLEVGLKILDRMESGETYSSCFIFNDNEDLIKNVKYNISEQEHKFTSTGIKFWRHQEQMINYLDSTGNSVISTHISPEGSCNLKCPYCSVTYRDTFSRISIDTIFDYVEKLKSRGLKSVILTGGGEPTAYPYFNDMVKWLKNDMKLSVALITNGTLSNKVKDESWKSFSWVRVSLNIFKDWENRIHIPYEKLNSDCIVGCSLVYTSEHESDININNQDRLEVFKSAAKIADKINATYIRVLPNCLLDQKYLIAQHESLDKDLEKINDSRFFHQYKIHESPKSKICHQSFFRPYLSEETFGESGIPGTVYPCDSVVLNESFQHFAKIYQLCRAKDILDYLDGKIQPKFNPEQNCSGCVFTRNINMLENWKNRRENEFSNYRNKIKHEEFV